MSAGCLLSRRAVKFALLSVGIWLLTGCPQKGASREDVIKIGILQSLSGTMATEEKSTADATLMAIDEINAQGGLLGKQLQPVIRDGRSDAASSVREAESLIVEDRVKAVFGLINSASRRAVRPVFEKHNHLLIYSNSYEGLEQSPNILHTGSAPNQQIIPAIKWCFDNVGKRFFLVGSDDVHSRAINAMVQDQVAALKGEVVGEEYLLWGNKDPKSVKLLIDKIIEKKPTVIINTLNYDLTPVFFRELRKAGITPDKTPTMSFTLGERELRVMDHKSLAGDYLAWSYFQGQTNPENLDFVKRYRAKFGDDQAVDDQAESVYSSVYLWATAVRAAHSASPDLVLGALPNQSYNAPEGLVYVDAENNHVWRMARIGRIDASGNVDVLWDSQRVLRPVPYPIYRSKADWESFLNDLYIGWKHSWAFLST